MKKIATFSGEIVGWMGKNYIVKNAIRNYNEGYIELYSENSKLISKRDEIRTYSKVAVGENYILFQENDPDNIYVLNPKELNAETFVVEGDFYLDYKQYAGNYIVIEEGNDSEYFYFDMSSLILVPSGFKIINIFNYTYSGYGIRYYKSCIYCYSLNTKELVWKINTHEMQYDRGGRHMAYSTPDNDVPDRCYFWDGLLITVFESHTAGIELSSGRIVWEDNLGSCSLRDFLDNGVLYVNRFGLFYQLDAATGKLLYERSIYVNDEELKYDFITRMVYNDKFIYFSMTRRRTLVTLRKDTFEVVSEEPLPYSGEGVLYENSTTYLVGNKLFLTFRNDPPQPLYETLVCEV